MDKIKICANHNYQVPLIQTFAFNGSEYWCPFCGHNYGMFDTGIDVNETPELIERHDKYKVFSREFLSAIGYLVCCGMIQNGEKIKPENLPVEEQNRLAGIRKNWKYGIKIENIK